MLFFFLLFWLYLKVGTDPNFVSWDEIQLFRLYLDLRLFIYHYKYAQSKFLCIEKKSNYNRHDYNFTETATYLLYITLLVLLDVASTR